MFPVVCCSDLRLPARLLADKFSVPWAGTYIPSVGMKALSGGLTLFLLRDPESCCGWSWLMSGSMGDAASAIFLFI